MSSTRWTSSPRGHPATAGPLYRRALQQVTKTSEQADDSAGAIGAVAARAVEGYAAACRLAPPDPVELAQWLVDFQLDGPGWPDIDITEFAEPLGADGLAAYWQHLTGLLGSTPDSAGRYDHRRYTLRHLKEDYLKTVSGDVDALVALYAEDVPEPYAYVQVGITLRDAGRTGEAVDWLCRGLREASRRPGVGTRPIRWPPTHPADAIPIYTQAVETAIEQKNKSGYAEAARLLGVLKELHERAGGDFRGYLATIKETHRRKSTLLAELARARL
jgi:hypothetical protein